MAAMTLHFLWNAPWWQPDPHFGLERALTYVAKGTPALALVVVLALAARVREVEWFAPALLGQPGVTLAELEALRTWKGRRTTRTAARSAGGWRGRRAARTLQAAQVRLAVSIASDWDAAEIDAARRRVVAARLALDRALAQPTLE